MTLIIEIRCDNAAFEPDCVPQVQRILEHVVRKLSDDKNLDCALFDDNGNKVGFAMVER